VNQNQNQNGCNTQTIFNGCRSCMCLYDDRYCKKWRDIVPDDVMKVGCDEIDEEPPF
jgi:hypothetical protein